MDRRTNETPMEFEWQTHAPGDATSPFYQLAREHERQNKKRPYNVFDSPAKSSTPTTQDNSSQASQFAADSRDSAFTTPHKVDFDFSSGAEVESSPDHADNDETPEPRSDRRDSIFNFYGRLGRSSGRGEIPRSNKLQNVVINRVKKRRRRDREIERHIRRNSEDTDGFSPGLDHQSSLPPPPSPHNQQQKEQKDSSSSSSSFSHEIPFFSRLFTFLETHPHIPRILSFYAQFAFNLILACLALYVVVSFLLAIRADIVKTGEDQSANILAEMAACAKSYVENRCGGEDGKRLPALEAVCDNWERCMNRDPAKVGRARLSAQTIAEIFNGFIEPISLKTMVFLIASFSSIVAVSNFTFSFFRNKSNHPPHASSSQPPPHSYTPFTPPTMHRHPSQLAYTSSRSAFGFDGGSGYFGDHNESLFNQGMNMSPSKRGRDDYGQRQMQLGYRGNDHRRTPSPIKGSRFA